MHDLVIRGGTVVDGTGAEPRTADVAVDDGQITAVGRADVSGRREIDADGLVVAPGWVDIHTHYDGQVSWDPELAPSSHHGVTTAIMGNCGVGFAPVRDGDQGFLIELMEGVEDIPGTALHEGIDWRWESFGEYLDALDATPRSIDLGGQLPHAAVRAYVLGERAHEYDVTADEIAQMVDITRRALADGAFGFSTSRTFLHRSKHGLVPGTSSTPAEVIAIAEAVRDSGHGRFQYVSDDLGTGGDEAWLDSLKEMGCPTTYTLAQTPADAVAYRRALDDAAASTAGGTPLVPQVPVRPTGMLFGLQSSFHPFIAHPSYRAIADRSLAERVAAMRDPQLRAQLLDEVAAQQQPLRQLHVDELRADVLARRSTRLRTAARGERGGSRCTARGATQVTSCSTGCSTTTDAASSSPRSATTSTEITKRCARCWSIRRPSPARATAGRTAA